MERIVVDSCCDLTAQMKEEMGIVSVPFTMNLGSREFRDDEKLDVDEFRNEMKTFSGKPGSSAPSPYLYTQALEKVKDAFIVTVSSKLSASFDNASIGKKQFEDDTAGAKAHIFDSKSASAGETLITIKLFELINSGMLRSEIIESMSRFINSMKTYFVLENFNNLKKNGRLGKIKGSLIQLLNFKLIAGSDGNGEIALYDRCRGVKQMLECLLSLIETSGRKIENENIVISHCNNQSLAKQLKGMIRERFNFKKIYLVPSGGLSTLYADNKGVILAF